MSDDKKNGIWVHLYGWQIFFEYNFDGYFFPDFVDMNSKVNPRLLKSFFPF